MIVDTSALIAIMRHEPERDRFLEALRHGNLRMSAVTLFELGIVVDGAGVEEASARLDRWVETLGIEVVAVDADRARAARAAYAKFGKGRHPARLNFGDCFAYALAKETAEPLLYKGEDFAQTDVEAAV